MPIFTVKIRESKVLQASVNAIDFMDAARRADDWDFDEEPSELESDTSTEILEIKVLGSQS